MATDFPLPLIDRRRFLVALPALLGVAAFARPDLCEGCSGNRHRAHRRRSSGGHPEPRRGITAARVAGADRLADHPEAIPVFAMVREIPQVIDGIRCACGCDEEPTNYSLLSCFEGDAMAAHCAVCLGQARLVHRLHRERRSLAQIRQAVDEAFA